MDFARRHPDVVLYISPHSSQAPQLLAEYRECGGRGGLRGDRMGPSLPRLCTASALPLPSSRQWLWGGGTLA